jgi:MFS family permease
MRIVTVLLAIAAVCSVPVAFASSVAGFSLLFIVATFFLGGIEPLLQADLSSRTPPGRRGMLFGVTTTIGNIGWFAAPMVGSAVSIASGTNMVFLTLAVFLGITMVIALALHLRGISHANRA